MIPGPLRADAARSLGIPLLPAELAFPPIIHQKLGVAMARDQFGITDESVLSAIGCHTTLRAGASRLDKVVFLADKLQWDQQDAAPYLPAVLGALEHSLDRAIICYLTWLHVRRQDLKVVHPWLRAAYEELTAANWD